MEYKKFITLDNLILNLEKIQYFKLNPENISVLIKESDAEIMNFKFKSEENFERFKSYIQLYSTEFECIQVEKEEKQILTENAQ